MEYEKARSDGYRTPREEREERWAAEKASSNNSSTADLFAGDKIAAREFYKSLGGKSKLKTKNTFGGSSGPRDRTGWGEGDDY